MLHQKVNGYDMAYIEVGQGDPIVCVHGSLCDFRVWSPVLGLLSRQHRVITPSLRRFFPEQWNGVGNDFTIAQHVSDLIEFLEAVGKRVNLLGHSRGGHIAFRVSQQRPDLLRCLVLAEPGGDLDASFTTETASTPPTIPTHVATSVAKIAAGDVDGGLASFVDAVNGPGVWRDLSAAAQQELRDNARTLLGQVNEKRQPYTRIDAEGMGVTTLFIGGENTPGGSLVVLRALATYVSDARVEIIPNTSHLMFAQAPVQFSTAVLNFLETVGTD